MGKLKEKIRFVPECPHVILCEGEDEKRFLIAYAEGFDTIRSILIVRDAEKTWQSAAASLRDAIWECFHVQCRPDGGFDENETYLRVGFRLLPGLGEDGRQRNGTLEDLCEDILMDASGEMPAEKLKDAAIKYVSEVQDARGKELRTPHKNKLHAYFAGTDKFVGMKIGEAGKAGCFDFSSPHLDFLKEAFIEMTCKTAE